MNLPSIINFDINQVGNLAKTVTTLALGGNLELLKTQGRVPLTVDVRRAQRTLTLQLFDASPTQPGTGVPRRQSSRPAPSVDSLGNLLPTMSDLQVIANVMPASSVPSAPSGPTLLGTISFDLTARTDGWPQRIEYGALSRQSEQATALGFHVNEWGVGIAPLMIDVLVDVSSNPAGATQKFFKMLYQGKKTRPLADEYPKLLRFFDSYLNKTLVITQRKITWNESAEEQNLGRLRIEAGILRDYDNDGYFDPAAQIAPNQLSGDASNVANSLGGLIFG